MVAFRPFMTASLLVLCVAPVPALAQRAGENAVNSADDAFGSSVGLEQTGIYTEQDTRGFSPAKAGNARIEGLYYDPVGSLSSRLRIGNTIRVGFAAEYFPFQAPTGIVEYRLRPFPDEFGVSLAYNSMAFGGFIREIDIRLPVADKRVGIHIGAAQSDLRQSDGSSNEAFGLTARVIAKIGAVEIAPFASYARFTANKAHPLVVVNGPALPAHPPVRRYLGQEWAIGNYDNSQRGVVVKVPLAAGLSLRAGIFHADGDKQENYTEILSLVPTADGSPPRLANHRLIADPEQRLRATSGEAQLAYRFATGRLRHRLMIAFRARERRFDTGGSDVRNLGQTPFGEVNPVAEPAFAFSPVNEGRIRQSAFGLAWTAGLQGLGAINLGLQKARYRATLRDGRSGLESTSRDDPWLYNASLGLNLTPSLSLFVATQKGLEDSGSAPENAANRNEQLPATRTRQYEAGLRWKFGAGQLAINAFQIDKPYFTFDAANVYARQGSVRHRGLEASLSGHFGERFNLLAGGVFMRPRVSGTAVDQGLIGDRPAGTPSVFVKLDANYRTDIFGGLTPTVAVTYTGSRAVGLRPQAALGGNQLMVPGFASVDLGLRQSFLIGKVPASFRFVVVNAFDAASWKVVAANTMYMDERRRINLTVTADF